MSYFSSAVYRDAGCPSQCMSENDYYGLMGEGSESCPAACLSDYATPDAGMSCPSVCNFNSTSQYASIPGYYSAIQIPATTASRIIPEQTLTKDYQNFNPRIDDVNGSVADAQQFAAMVQNAEAQKQEAFRWLRNRRQGGYAAMQNFA
jgi:hypothetical protein